MEKEKSAKKKDLAQGGGKEKKKGKKGGELSGEGTIKKGELHRSHGEVRVRRETGENNQDVGKLTGHGRETAGFPETNRSF